MIFVSKNGAPSTQGHRLETKVARLSDSRHKPNSRTSLVCKGSVLSSAITLELLNQEHLQNFRPAAGSILVCGDFYLHVALRS